MENVDKFADIMDRISNGGFLRGEENELGNDWVELNWLKAMGYYGIEAFLANRIEVSLRMAWLNSGGGGGGGGGRKRGGVKLKEKMNSASVAANVFWRKKGCVDWWEKIDALTRKRVLSTILSKAAKPLVPSLGTFETIKFECVMVIGNTSVNCLIFTTMTSPEFWLNSPGLPSICGNYKDLFGCTIHWMIE